MGRVYKLREWQRTRLAFLTEHPLCKFCHEAGRLTPAEHVDHITPIAEGGAWFDPSNLQALCASCHSLKTHRDAPNSNRSYRPGCDANGIPVDTRHPWNSRKEH